MKRGLILLCLFLAVSGGAIHKIVSARQASGWRKLHQSAVRDAGSGGLQGLLRARIAGVRLAVSDGDDPDLLAELAFLNAALTHLYGLPTAGEASAFLQRLGEVPADPAALAPAARSAWAGAQTARALLALEDGNWARANQLARQAAAWDTQDVRPMLALARLHARAGDLVAASNIAETAAVNAPEAAAARVEWAEARLDLGQPQAALDVLHEVLAQAPDHARALLLAGEAQQAVHEARSEASDQARLTAMCGRDGAISAVVEVGCLLHAAAAARLRGDRQTALDGALAAAAIAIDDPRTLSRNACILITLGQIDKAHDLVARAAQRASAHLPALAWARVGLALGRGQSAAQPAWLRAGHPETVLLAARAAFASAGPAALAKVLAENQSAHPADPDLLALAGLTTGAAAALDDAAALAQSPSSRPRPVQAYVAGLRARLRGELDPAARWLGQALTGHGDACRAAGEYLVVMRLLHRPVGHELEALQATNRDCLNLALPPPRRDPHIVDPLHDTGVRRPKR